MKKNIFLLLFYFSFNTVVFSQKPEKGSSPDRPWNDPVQNGKLYARHDSIEKYIDHFTTALFFGKWEFSARYPEYNAAYTNQVKDSLKFFSLLMDVPRNSKMVARYYTNVDFKGEGPEKSKFTGSFFYTDSLFETYGEKGFFAKEVNYQAHLFRKTANGYIHTSTNDSASFNIDMYFENEDSILNQKSFLHAGKNDITLSPVFETKVDKKDARRSLYLGFNFILNDKIIAGAAIHTDFGGGRSYKYWMNNELDKSTSEAIASTLFIIVSFF